MRDRDSLRLVIAQAPQHAKVATGKEKDRKPIDPPPILKIDLRNHNQNYANFILSSPSLFVQVYLKPGDKKTKMDPETCAKGLVGSTVSSLQKYKSIDGQDEGYFVFPDLSVKMEGFFKLRFALYNMKGGEAVDCGFEKIRKLSRIANDSSNTAWTLSKCATSGNARAWLN
ncbi:uncharacterized protein N0V96_006277 [Colletotrichum fioriniae]|uniref:uncharacterized protein n=1 Tax=Colletotrichum fioriniae TaxID=710243 RepID=UPI0032DA6273|nr:hypothetical protein N0V96_006277 [Colletotrichum fioriniae]